MNEKIGRRSFLKTLASTAAIAFSCKQSNEASTGNKDSTIGGKSSSKMPLKKLGSTGVDIPILQQGTAQVLNPVYDKVLHLCYREGVTVFDTALSYGWGASHFAMSKFLEQVGKRKKVWVTSKSGNRSTGGLTSDLDKCLKDMKLDYLDLYLMHSVSHPSLVKKTYLNLGDRLKKSGKTRFFGLSTHDNSAAVMKKAAETGGIDVILFRYSFRRFGDKELNLAIDACKKRGIGLIAMKTMDSIPASEEKVVKFKSKNFSLAQAKLKSVWEDERIDTVVSEMSSIKEAHENIAAAKSGVSLSAGEAHQLNRLAAISSELSCSGCSSICESMLKGETRISDTLRFLMYHESYGKPDIARRLYNEMPQSARDFSMEEIQNAQKSCPQGIEIASRLKAAERILKS